MEKELFRTRCRQVLHTPIEFWGKTINGFIAVLIVLSVAAIPLYFIPQLNWAERGLTFFEIFTTIIFTIEYILRVWSAYRPLQYVFSWYGIIDIISILPFYLGIFGIIDGVHFFLVLRILRILKLGKIYCNERTSVTKTIKKTHGTFSSMEDEVIEGVAQKHPIIFLITLIPPIVFTSVGMLVFLIFKESAMGNAFSLLLFVFAFVFFLKSWLDFHYDVIYITNHRVIFQNRQIFGTRLNDIMYESITNIRPDNTGFIRFMFGFGDVHIETAASSGNREFTNVADPHAIVTRISRNRKIAMDQKEGKIQKKEEEPKKTETDFRKQWRTQIADVFLDRK